MVRHRGDSVEETVGASAAFIVVAMPQAKKMRLGSSDEWPPQNDVVVAEGPLVLFPDGKEPTPRPDAVLLSQGTKVEQALTAFDVQNLSLALSELAVLRITRDVYRAVQLKSESTEVYIIISADVERTLIQKHIRSKDRKVNYRLWLDNSIAFKKPQSTADRQLFGNYCYLSTPLCTQLQNEKLEKMERKPRGKTDSVTVHLAIDANLSLSPTDAIALLSGAKKLVLLDKGKNEVV